MNWQAAIAFVCILATGGSAYGWHAASGRADALAGKVELLDSDLAALRELRREDQRAIDAAAKRAAAARAERNALTRKISQLEKDNAEITDFLNRPIPLELRRLLDAAAKGKAPDNPK